jgi:hypothetical protein
MMPIGAKMYEAAAEEAKSEADSKSETVKDSDEPIEGEVVDKDDKKS